MKLCHSKHFPAGKNQPWCLKVLNLCSGNSFSGDCVLQSLEEIMSQNLSWFSRVESFPSDLSSYNLVYKPQLHFNQVLLARMTLMTESGVEAAGKTQLYDQSWFQTVWKGLQASSKFTAVMVRMSVSGYCTGNFAETGRLHISSLKMSIVVANIALWLQSYLFCWSLSCHFILPVCGPSLCQLFFNVVVIQCQ